MHTLRHYIFTSICTTAILLLSLLPVPEVPQLDDTPFIDKWAHFVMYGGLMLSVWLDWTRHRHHPLFVHSLTAVLGSIALGGLIELIQPLVGRSGEWLDFYADTLGTVLGFAAGLTASHLLSRGSKDN